MSEYVYDEKYVFNFFEKYLNVNSEIVENALSKQKIENKKPVYCVDKKRIQAILKAIDSSCEKFCDVTDNKRKTIVADKLLNNLDYNAFYKKETYAETESRLKEVFDYTSKKDINVYNLIGSTMLVESNLCVKRDNPNNKKEITDAYEWAPRMVWNIYDSVKNMGFSDDETISIFEKAKTIFSKGYSTNIDEFYSVVKHGYFVYKSGSRYYNVLNEKDFKNIVKTLSTILVDPASKVKTIVDCLVKMSENKLNVLQANYDFEYDNYLDGDLVFGFVKGAIVAKPGLLKSKVSKDDDGLSVNYKSEEIKQYVDSKFEGYIKSLGISLVDERDRMSDEEEFEKYGDGERKRYNLEHGIQEDRERYEDDGGLSL